MGEYSDKYWSDIFVKFSDEELLNDIKSFQTGRNRLGKILPHFFKECMYNCSGKKYTMTPIQVLQSDEHMKWVVEYIKSKPNFYYQSDMSKCIESYFRNSTRYTRKVANFNPVEARDIYTRYFESLNGIKCLDTSAGFGSRMLSSVLSGGGYCGIDPNVELCKKLNECYDFLKNNNIVSQDQYFKIYCCGSEVFIPELVDTFDVSFTSPPYFNLEKYSDDCYASTRNQNDYQKWIEEFVIPTVNNTYKYLKTGGYAMINIKNIDKKHELFDDWMSVFKSIKGFNFVEVFDYKQYSPKYWNKINDVDKYPSKEPIMSFQKIE